MVVDIFEMLIDILKINQSLVNDYASQGALYQMFYLFIFPTVFIVFFIWILSNSVIKRHKGMRLLISLAVYAFIILQGYYSWFVMLSKFWLFGLMILGFLYLIIPRLTGGGAKGMTDGGGNTGPLGKLTKRFQLQVTGQEKQLTNVIKHHMGQLRSMSTETHAYGQMYFDTEKELARLETIVRETDITGVGFTKFGGKEYEKLFKEFLNLHKPKAAA